MKKLILLFLIIGFISLGCDEKKKDPQVDGDNSEVSDEMNDMDKEDIQDEVDNEVVDEMDDEVMDEVDDEIVDEVDNEVMDEVDDEVMDDVDDEVMDEMNDEAMDDEIVDEVDNEIVDEDIVICECSEVTDCCDGCNYIAAGTDCADEFFCNGEEKCDGAGTCKAETPACPSSGCLEETETCCATTGNYGDACDICVKFVKESGLTSDSSNPDLGKTWDAAYESLNDALSAAQSQISADINTNKCQIWVSNETLTFDDISTGITIPQRVGIYGGFSGTERDLNERVAGKRTVFDGSVSGEKINDLGYVFALSDNATLDGFEIKNLVYTNYEYKYDSCDAAPVLIDSSQNVVVSNCSINNNSFFSDASGLCINGALAEISDCELFDNFTGEGYGILLSGNNDTTLKRVNFSSNTGWSGGGVFTYTFGGTIKTEAAVFSNNSNAQKAAFNLNSFSGSDGKITNSTFTGNYIALCDSYDVAGLKVWGFNDIDNSVVALNTCDIGDPSNFRTSKSSYSESTFHQSAIELSEGEVTGDYDDYTGLIFVDGSSSLFENVTISGTWTSDAVYDSVSNTTTFTDSASTWVTSDANESSETTVFVEDMGLYCDKPVESGTKVYIGCVGISGTIGDLNSICRNFGDSSDNSTVSSLAENNIVASLATENIMLGNSKDFEGNWDSYNEPTTYTNWATGEPVVDQNGTTVRMYGSGHTEAGKWYTLAQDSEEKVSVVCEVEKSEFVQPVFARRVVSVTDTTITVTGKFDDLNKSGDSYTFKYVTFMPLATSVLIDKGDDAKATDKDFYGNDWTDTASAGTENVKSDIGAVDYRP